MVVGGPYCGGQSHHRQPLFSTCKMPLITRRSSTRSFPRTSVGKNGSILCHCSSFSQNKLRLMISAPISRAATHYPIHLSSPLLSLDPSRSSHPVISPIPLDEPWQALVDRGRGMEAEI